jgi:phage/plasmid-like protein (TIGR03299 family)
MATEMVFDAVSREFTLREIPVVPLVSESIVKASTETGRWGDAEFHNLENGARASGDVVSAHSLLKGADLDWDPEFRPLFAGSREGTVGPRGAQIGEYAVNPEVGRAVVRSDNGQAIGIVGARYALIPHRKLADLADALCGADGAHLHFGNAGHKDGGARPFLQLKSEARTLGHGSSKDIAVRDVITLMTAHDGTLQALATYGANVIVCDNTYAHALGTCKAQGIKIRHTASGIATIEEAIRIAKATREYSGAFDNAALSLMSRRMGDSEMRQLASVLIPGDSMRAENERGKLMSAWVGSPGAAPGSAWGAAQAVTYYTTHEIATHEGTDRAFNLATGEGRGSDVQAQAWWHLTTEEGTAALQTVKLYRC